MSFSLNLEIFKKLTYLGVIFWVDNSFQNWA